MLRFVSRTAVLCSFRAFPYLVSTWSVPGLYLDCICRIGTVRGLHDRWDSYWVFVIPLISWNIRRYWWVRMIRGE